MAELRLPLRLGAGSGGMETGPPSAEPEERGQCCCVPDSRTTHTGVAVGQLPASAPRHAPVLWACRLLGGLAPAPPFAVFSAQGPVRSRSSRIHSADGQAGPGDQEHELVPGEWGAPEDADPQVRTGPPGAPPLAGCSVQVPKARPAHPWAWPSAGIRTSPVCPGGDQAGRRAGASLYPGVSFPGAAPRPSLAGRVSPHPSFLSGKSQK